MKAVLAYHVLFLISEMHFQSDVTCTGHLPKEKIKLRENWQNTVHAECDSVRFIVI